ncbi:MAG: polysaccharide biosynthesis protein [Brevinematia bacterium]
MKNVLVIGAGVAGQIAVSLIQNNERLEKLYNVIGFLDDNPSLEYVLDFPVLGKIDEASFIIKKYSVDEVLIAIPSANEQTIKKILKIVLPLRVQVKIVPGFYEIVEGSFDLRQIRKVNFDDLLGREEVGFDVETISPFYKDKRIFVTGGGGSIGSEIVNQLLSLPVAEIMVLGHGENSIHSLLIRHKGVEKLKYVIGDIRDLKKIKYEMKKFSPDIVFHAAAHKHVPLMEKYPDEAVKNNIIGSFNVASVAIESGVKNFVLISTDKAINPRSVMGATKRIAEKIVLSLNKFCKTRFNIVRFGNVLGSRGSVVLTFKEQIESGGPLTVTHPEVTRYFMSIREASRLVIKSPTVLEGEIFVLDMGKPVKIVDLARNMLYLYGYNEDEIPIVFTGLKKGEKLHEEIMSNREKLISSKFEKLFISKEKELIFSKDEIYKMIKEFEEVADTFDVEKILKVIKKYCNEYTQEEVYE